MASDEAIAAADAAKAAANKLYAENKLDEAIQAYTTALQLLPELDGSDEDVVASLVGSKEAGLRAILLTNRAQCLLMQGKVLVSADGLHSSEARKLFMKASLDAGLAAELDPSYAKAHLRKGIATLGMPETQQRSKEAVMALQAALKCRVTPELKKEIEDTLKWAQHRRFEAVDMPENCAIM